jgi:quercetin dioxygenase-like cupin family protein
MKIVYPHTIENKFGEKLIFKGIEKGPDGERMIVENYVQPGCGPLMHTHFQQDESLTVVNGTMGYQLLGEAEKIAKEGDTVTFKAGSPHRFWNAGEDVLHCTGWVSPPNSLAFYLTAIYQAMDNGKGERPETFDAAWLLTTYASEYDMPSIPSFVKKVIMPTTVFIGKLLGKYKHFKDAPAPLK